MKVKLSPPRLKLSSLGLDKLNVAGGALMLWVALGPWVWGYASSGSAVANHVFLIFAVGPLTLLVVALRPAAFAVLAAGLWLAASPWLLGYATNHSAWLSELVTGVLLVVVGGRAAGLTKFLPGPRRRRRGAAASRSAQPAGSRS